MIHFFDAEEMQVVDGPLFLLEENWRKGCSDA